MQSYHSNGIIIVIFHQYKRDMFDIMRSYTLLFCQTLIGLKEFFCWYL